MDNEGDVHIQGTEGGVPWREGEHSSRRKGRIVNSAEEVPLF